MGRPVIEERDDALLRDLANLAAESHMEIDAQAKHRLRRAVPIGDRGALATHLDAIAALTSKNAAPSTAWISFERTADGEGDRRLRRRQRVHGGT